MILVSQSQRSLQFLCAELPHHVQFALLAMSAWSAFEATFRRDPSMTRSTRRTTRNSASELPGSGAAGSGSPTAETDHAYSQEDLCPSCSASLTRDLKDEDSESWVRCDFCKTWYHWRCVGENGQLETIDKWLVLPLPPIILLLHSWFFTHSQVLRAL